MDSYLSGAGSASTPEPPTSFALGTGHLRLIADCRQSRSLMDPQVCSVRRFRTEEWAAYRDLRLRSLVDAPDAFGSTLERESAWPEQHWADRVSKAVDSQTTLLLVAETGTDPVGLVSGFIDPAEPEIAHVFQMWVAPHARGRGCGSVLLEAVLAWVRGTDARSVTLCVTCGNSSALRLYERAGFTRLGEPEPLRPGSTVLAQPMVLTL